MVSPLHTHMLQVSGSNVENVSPQVIRRVTKEVMELAESPPEGIKVFINEEDITDIQATITGPGIKEKKDTRLSM